MTVGWPLVGHGALGGIFFYPTRTRAHKNVQQVYTRLLTPLCANSAEPHDGCGCSVLKFGRRKRGLATLWRLVLDRDFGEEGRAPPI